MSKRNDRNKPIPNSFEIKTSTTVKNILDWPTNTFAIDYVYSDRKNKVGSVSMIVPAHTAVIFVPGNPGLMEWYLPVFCGILERLGPGYCCRGASLAGHAVTHDLVNVQAWEGSHVKNTSISWTIQGQVLHKAAYLDLLVKEDSFGTSTSSNNKNLQFIFVCHSIGCYFAQQLLVLRKFLALGPTRKGN